MAAQRLPLILILAFSGAAMTASARADSPAAADDFQPSAINQPGREYPQVNSEGRVRARIVAPEANAVLLDIGGVKYPMTRDEGGAWTGDSEPQDEGFHYYQLVVDGAQVPDPGTTYFYGAGRWGSGVEVPAADQDFYALKDVPHGVIREHYYYSQADDSMRHCFVYAPPGYDADATKRYPVLYLQHGGGENEYSWPHQGLVNLIMDNLIAKGEAVPFLIVMDNGTWKAPNGARRGGAWPPAGWSDGFKKTLLEGVIPMIDANYRTLADQPNRAMAGLSMGGMQTNAIAMENLDVFSHIGIFSGGTVGDPASAHGGVMSDAEEFNAKVKLIFQSCGSKERPEALRANHQQLRAAGLNSVCYISPNTAHEWQTWRRSLKEFAQLLFQDEPLENAAPSPQPKPTGSDQAAEALRINAGAYQPFADSAGVVWLAEEGFDGGATIDRNPSTKIEGSEKPQLYRSEHYAMNSFSVKIPNGRYVATLHFAETFEGIHGPGERVFSFNVQGRVFKDFDIWVKAGGPNRAYVETTPVDVTDGQFRIDFASQVENPAINAIELVREDASVSQEADSVLKDAYAGDFLIGVAINRTIATDTAVRADNVNRTLDQVRGDTVLVLKQFNSVSPENDLKWALIHPHPGPDGYDWAPADAFVEFGNRHNMYVVGHTLVWHSQTPDWVFAGTIPPPEPAVAAADSFRRRFGYQGPRASRDELLQRMHDHIHAVVGRYKGKVQAWDVVNEAISDGGDEVLRNSLWKQIVGDDFIAKAFQFAHEADPDALLRYNDYGLENPAKRAKLIKLIKSLQEQDVPVMAIGTQTHISASSPTYEEMDQALTELASLGLPIHVTELDVNTAQEGQRRTTADLSEDVSGGGLVDRALERQAQQYANVFKTFLSHKDSVKLVTFWGANDGVSWRANGKPLLFDRENQPKPAFEAVIRVAEER
ncbi:MAG: endo-1,4-beta-xylanase [Planctomycetales bacterium]|nr:endo-1,4-beta-xylanase [Planctomycetales bacterium]